MQGLQLPSSSGGERQSVGSRSRGGRPCSRGWAGEQQADFHMRHIICLMHFKVPSLVRNMVKLCEPEVQPPMKRSSMQ